MGVNFNKVVIRPYSVLWLFIPIVWALISLDSDGLVTIPIHDVYFVIGTWFIASIISLVLFFLGGIYWLLRNFKLNRTLTFTHLPFTLLAVLLVVSLIAFLDIFLFTQDGIRIDHQKQFVFHQIFVLILVAAIASQVGLIINILFTVLRRK